MSDGIMIREQTSSGAATPNRKTDQWHRLASVVRSSQKTFVSNSPLAGVSSILRCRTKRGFDDGSLNTFTRTPDRHEERKRLLCKNSGGDQRGSPASVHVATPGKTHPLVAVNSGETTPSKMRSLASYSHIKQKPKLPTPSHQKKNRSENSQSFQRRGGWSCKFVTAFMLLVVSVGICVSFVVHSRRHHEAMLPRKLSKYDVGLLRKTLRHRVYGQHIVTESIPSAVEKLLDAHALQQGISAEDGRSGGAKMTVMSLHGWTGVGKTFVTQLLVDSLKPENFLRFIIPIHFPHILHDDGYKNRIKHDIMTNITSSTLNLIVFDEMDKASLGVLEGIRSVILSLRGDNSYKDSTVIVVFVSNTLGRSVNSRLFELLLQGRQREHITSIDFRDLFFQDGDQSRINPWYTLFTDHNLIDSFIPFLPLDINHVSQCIKHNLGRKGAKVTSSLVNAILAELSLFRPTELSSLQYSHTGCKRVAEKVDLHLDHIS